MFNALYDKATHHCNECNWDGDGWKLKDNKCPKCKSKNIEAVKEGENVLSEILFRLRLHTSVLVSAQR